MCVQNISIPNLITVLQIIHRNHTTVKLLKQEGRKYKRTFIHKVKTFPTLSCDNFGDDFLLLQLKEKVCIR